MEEVDKAWSAGFLDGEGHISLVAQRRFPGSYSLVVAAYNTNKAPIDKLVDLFGGNILLRDSLHPREAPWWRWALYGRKAYGFLLEIEPYCIEKAPQIELAKEFYEVFTRHPNKWHPLTDVEKERRQKIHAKFKELNRRGR